MNDQRELCRSVSVVKRESKKKSLFSSFFLSAKTTRESFQDGLYACVFRRLIPSRYREKLYQRLKTKQKTKKQRATLQSNRRRRRRRELQSSVSREWSAGHTWRGILGLQAANSETRKKIPLTSNFRLLYQHFLWAGLLGSVLEVSFFFLINKIIYFLNKKIVSNELKMKLNNTLKTLSI